MLITCEACKDRAHPWTRTVPPGTTAQQVSEMLLAHRQVDGHDPAPPGDTTDAHTAA